MAMTMITATAGGGTDTMRGIGLTALTPHIGTMAVITLLEINRGGGMAAENVITETNLIGGSGTVGVTATLTGTGIGNDIRMQRKIRTEKTSTAQAMTKSCQGGGIETGDTAVMMTTEGDHTRINIQLDSVFSMSRSSDNVLHIQSNPSDINNISHQTPLYAVLENAEMKTNLENRSKSIEKKNCLAPNLGSGNWPTLGEYKYVVHRWS